jgi:hypothetical protein
MAARANSKRARLRILRFLADGGARICAGAARTRALLDAGARGRLGTSRDVLDKMGKDGLVLRRGGEIALSKDGLAMLRRCEAAGDPFQDQHRELEEIRVDLPDGPETALLNLAESPLSQLARLSDRKGAPFLSKAEFRAGEQLRRDYERGRIMPRLAANWEAPVARGRRDGAAAELTDAALAARQRVDHAIAAVGPELAGMLIDICCFLKGLERVEMERGWPVRSAKVVLKTALAALARHYEPSRSGRHKVLHWGAEDYRPRMGSRGVGE